MALVKCPECGKEISDEAWRCPHCDYRLRSFQLTEYLSAALGAVVVAYIIAAQFFDVGQRTITETLANVRFLLLFLPVLIVLEIAIYGYYASITGTRRRD